MSFLDEIENNRGASSSSAIITSASSNPFDDEDTEVAELEKFVRGFQARFSELRQAVNAIGTTRDSEANREKIDSTFKSCQSMVSQGKGIISAMSSASSSKAKAEKLKNDFLKITQQFVTTSKTLPEKLKLSIPQKVQRTKTYNDGSQEEQQSLLDQRRAELQRVEIERENHARIVAERDEQIRKVEQGVVEINEMFKDVAKLVDEQDVTINTIDANITQSVSTTNEAVKELDKAQTYQKKSSKKLKIILAITAAILLIVAIIVIIKVTKK